MDQSVVNFLTMLDNPAYSAIFILLAIWTLAWKGVALWRSARNGQRNWFMAMLVINTIGILEIIYVFYFSKVKRPADTGKIS